MKIDKNSKLYNFGKPFLILVLIFIVVYILSNFIFQTGKIKPSKEYVYTIIEKNNRLRERTVPTINLRGKKIKKINQEIKRLYERNEKYRFRNFYYSYDVTDNILSLVVLSNYLPDDAEQYIYQYNTYFINVKTSKVLTVDEILKKYNKTKVDISEQVDEQMKKMYQTELEEKVITESSCDYQCFKDERNMDSDFDNLALAIKEGKLVAYTPFYEYTSYDTKLYTKDDFMFKIN